MAGDANNTVNADTSSVASGTPAPKRIRVSRACEQCRSRKAKCDGQTPTCSTCASLNQQCSYGPPPKKRGLPPGSFSMLERTVKLYEKIFGAIFTHISSGEDVFSAIIRKCGKSLIEDGPEGEKFLKAWKEGRIVIMLESLQNGSMDRQSKSEEAQTPSLDTAQHLFQDALRVASMSEHDGEETLREFSEADQFGAIDWFGDSTVDEFNSRETAPSAYVHEGNTHRDPPAEAQVRVESRSPNAIDPLLIGSNMMSMHENIGSNLVNTNLQFRASSFTPTPTYIPPPSFTPPPSFPSYTASHIPQFPVSPTSHPSLVSPKTLQQPQDVELPKNSKQLLDLYFAYTHIWFPILDKYEVIRLYHSLYPKSTSNRLSVSQRNTPIEVSSTKKALLYAVLALASLQHDALTRQESVSATLYVASQDLLFASEPSLETVQSLLLLSLYNLTQSQNATAWLLLGNAGRIAIANGFHRNQEPKQKSRFATRTWLGYVLLEVFASGIVNERSIIRSITRMPDWDQTSIEEDGWEEWDSWGDLPLAITDDNEPEDEGSPAHMLSVFNQLLSLSLIIKDLREAFDQGEQERVSGQSWIGGQENLKRLRAWVQGCPPHCAPSFAEPASRSRLPHVMNLHLFYLKALSLVPAPVEMLGGPDTLGASTSLINGFKASRSLAVVPSTFVHFLNRTGSTESSDTVSLRQELITQFLSSALSSCSNLLRELKLTSPMDKPSVPLSNWPNPALPSNTPYQPSASEVFASSYAATSYSRPSLSNTQSQTQPTSAPLSQTAPSPDTLDEEMGMLECLPWSQQDIPNFMQNLGYIGGLSPSTFQNNLGMTPGGHDSQPLDFVDLQQEAPMSAFPEPDVMANNTGLNTVLEQWLREVMGAGGKS